MDPVQRILSLPPEEQPCRIARYSIAIWVVAGRAWFPEPVSAFPAFLREPKPCFVTLEKGGQLRGCMGTIEATEPAACREIARVARMSATEDPRFPPVQENEVDHLEIHVDLLHSWEAVADPSSLNPRRYGVLVEWQGRRALLLPDIPGVDTVEEQLQIVRLKAGIPAEVPHSALRLTRFRVDRYREASPPPLSRLLEETDFQVI